MATAQPVHRTNSSECVAASAALVALAQSTPVACDTQQASRKRPAASQWPQEDEDTELSDIYRRGDISKWARTQSDQSASSSTGPMEVDNSKRHASPLSQAHSDAPASDPSSHNSSSSEVTEESNPYTCRVISKADTVRTAGSDDPGAASVV